MLRTSISDAFSVVEFPHIQVHKAHCHGTAGTCLTCRCLGHQGSFSAFEPIRHKSSIVRTLLSSLLTLNTSKMEVINIKLSQFLRIYSTLHAPLFKKCTSSLFLKRLEHLKLDQALMPRQCCLHRKVYSYKATLNPAAPLFKDFKGKQKCFTTTTETQNKVIKLCIYAR